LFNASREHCKAAVFPRLAASIAAPLIRKNRQFNPPSAESPVEMAMIISSLD
jgi:hypothetical protein